MSITVTNNQFHLRTKATSYIIGVYESKYITHLYWGKRLEHDLDLTYIPDAPLFSRASAFHVIANGKETFVSDLPLEFSVNGGGDYRTPSVRAKYESGSTVSEFVYDGYKIYDGKRPLDGLPSTYTENDSEAQTLEITLIDLVSGLCAVLSYTVFEDYDIITRDVRYINNGNETIHLLSAQSMCVDFFGQDYRILNLNGDWARECNIEFTNVKHGIFTIDSKRGMSSHMNNPFAALLCGNADEESGEVYGFSLVYSGNFCIDIEGSSCGGTRVVVGINHDDFDWIIEPNDVFQTPEAVITYSDKGIGEMSRKYHRMYRERLCRGKWRDRLRPMLINHWEATAMNFTEEQLVSIAKSGASIGLELFVVDDGWYGERNRYDLSVGDWYVNRDKLPHGLAWLADNVNKMGMKFGLWFEPETVSVKSELYEKHPDWCIRPANRERILGRYSLTLDLSREDVRKYIVKSVTDILNSANIEYVKWDCNQNLIDTANQMQSHKYVLGLYDVLQTITSRFPNVLFEGCSGGGGRFDPGMLCYMPQTWTSDMTHPISRLCIQHGTSVVYPPICMTAHIGAIAVGSKTHNRFMDTAAAVAMAADFGFEMDLTQLSQTEYKQAKGYVDLYKQIRKTIQFGEFYRLESPFSGSTVSWEFVDDEKTVIFTYQTRPMLNGEERRVYLRGLKEDAVYTYEGRNYYGEELMRAGIRIPLSAYEFESRIMVFEINK